MQFGVRAVMDTASASLPLVSSGRFPGPLGRTDLLRNSWFHFLGVRSVLSIFTCVRPISSTERKASLSLYKVHGK